MADASDWRQEIEKLMTELWPELPKGAVWIESQVQAESGGDPKIESPAGAIGLLQLMPATAAEVGVDNLRDPIKNLRGGILYLKKQYERLSSIPGIHRLFWSFAAYNCGMGYVKKALIFAEQDADGDWRSFDVGRFWLMHRLCEVGGRWPIYKQVWHYVRRIRVEFTKRVEAQG